VPFLFCRRGSSSVAGIPSVTQDQHRTSAATQSRQSSSRVRQARIASHQCPQTSTGGSSADRPCSTAPDRASPLHRSIPRPQSGDDSPCRGRPYEPDCGYPAAARVRDPCHVRIVAVPGSMDARATAGPSPTSSPASCRSRRDARSRSALAQRAEPRSSAAPDRHVPDHHRLLRGASGGASCSLRCTTSKPPLTRPITQSPESGPSGW